MTQDSISETNKSCHHHNHKYHPRSGAIVYKSFARRRAGIAIMMIMTTCSKKNIHKASANFFRCSISSVKRKGCCFVPTNHFKPPIHTPSIKLLSPHCRLTSSRFSSSMRITRTELQSNSPPPPPKRPIRSRTGLLRLLPPLSPSNELLSRSLRSLREIKPDPTVGNVKRRAQKYGAQSIDCLSQRMCLPLRETVDAYRRLYRNMHPFERVVMDLTVTSLQKRDGTTLSSLLEDVHTSRVEMLNLSKDWISKIKLAESAKEAYDSRDEAERELARVFGELIGGCWSGMIEVQRALRVVPMVMLDCPAVVLVGAPNVGKSSIVRSISSGTPEVNNYPFTTRGMTLGHVQVFWESDDDVALGNVAGVGIPTEKELVSEKLIRRGVQTRRMKEGKAAEEFSRGTSSKRSFPVSQLCQIMDSPGLLRREEGEVRNEMEKLTLAAMSHLPTAVMFVMDFSGGAGDKCSSLEDQLILRKEVRSRFPKRPWIDVISKVDLGVADGARERLWDILDEERKGTSGQQNHVIELSIKEGKGVEELRQEVMRMLGEVRVVLDAMAAVDDEPARDA